MVEILVDQLNKSARAAQQSGTRTSFADLAMSPKLGGADMVKAWKRK
jgi:hypothetical protein